MRASSSPEHLVGDQAYDSDGLDDALKQDGMEPDSTSSFSAETQDQDGLHLSGMNALARRMRLAWLQ